MDAGGIMENEERRISEKEENYNNNWVKCFISFWGIHSKNVLSKKGVGKKISKLDIKGRGGGMIGKYNIYPCPSLNYRDGSEEFFPLVAELIAPDIVSFRN